MTFDLASSNEEYFTTDSEQTFSLDYEISSPVEVSAQQSANMTFVIDMNRLLRYYNRGGTDSGPVPGSTTIKPIFLIRLLTGLCLCWQAWIDLWL